MTDDQNPYQKLRDRRNRAIIEAREALHSVSDEDEISGLIQAVAEGVAEGAVKATQRGRAQIPSDRVEIHTPAGFKVTGKVWALVVMAVVIAALMVLSRLIQPR